MKTKSAIYFLIYSGLFLFLFFSCTKEKIKTIPTVTAIIATNITSTTASLGGIITANGGATVTTSGVCYSLKQNPTTIDNNSINGATTGSFTNSLTGLSPNTTYYVEAYATNSVGTGYSSQVTFTTLASLPSITTTAASSIGSAIAISGGNITSNGGANISERGIYWGTTQNPETAGTKLKSDSTTNIFNVTLTGIIPNTTYYIKAYATNSAGTIYGNQINFKTSDFQMAVLNVSQSTPWNFWAIAKDGSNFFIKFDNNIPVSAFFQPSIGQSGYVVYFDTRGLPSKMVIQNYVFLFANFRSTLVDIASIDPNGNINIYRNLSVNVDQNLFPLKSAWASSNAVQELHWASQALGLASCAVALIPTVLTPFALVDCTSTILGIAAQALNIEVYNVPDDVGYISGIIQCSVGDFDACITTAAGIAIDASAYALQQLNTQNAANATYQLQIPSVTTNTVLSVSTTSATGGGNVTSQGGSPVLACGVCWSTSPTPAISDAHTVDGSGIGSYTSLITNLTPGVNYYVRAYATNSQGTGYGLAFSLNGLSADINNLVPQSILDAMQTLGMPVASGFTPPIINGTFNMSPLVLYSTNIINDNYYIGEQISDLEVQFYNQDNAKLTVETSYINGPESGSGFGSFVAGSGNDFTVFAKVNAVSQGYPVIIVQVYSGTIGPNGIYNLFDAIFMIENYGMDSIFMSNGSGRVFYDQDGFSETIPSLKSLNFKNIKNLGSTSSKRN